MHLPRLRLTYSNVIATLALFLALGGAAYAATKLPKNSVGTKQLKPNAVTTAKIKDGAVTGAKVNASSLGTVPNAAQAANATQAAHAADASHAAFADDSAHLGGVAASGYLPQVARSGETLTGQLSEHAPPGEEFWLAGGSYRSPLPASAPTPNLVVLFEGEESAPGCPGTGQASAGMLCVYIYNQANLESVDSSGNSSDPNRRYGFSLDVFADELTEEAWIIASWAYQVP